MSDLIFNLQPWWGKLAGIFLGYLYAGPYGAMFGIILGNLADRIIFNYLFSPQWHHYRSASAEVQNLYYPTLFKVMGHLAKIDGHISEDDISVARQVMNEMRLHGYKKHMAMKCYNQGKLPLFDLHRALNLMHRLCSHHPGLLKLFVLTLYRTAKIDGINPQKEQKLNIIFSRLGFIPLYRQGNYQHHRRHTAQSNFDYDNAKPLDDFSIIGVKPIASNKEIKRAYRKKISQIHPDKLIARSASQKDIEIATNQTQLLQAAYDRIKNARGF